MEFFISYKNIEAVVFAKSRKNSCSFLSLDVIPKGRSPPLDFDFQNLEIREMGEHPKRRKDKYNPYFISVFYY